MNTKFSVAMSVYKNDKPSQLQEALESICTQSYPASEIYLVIDGPIGDELQSVIDEYAEKYGNFTVNQLSANGGLGNALKIAVENCKYDLIMRMDSDDISAPGRFYKLIKAYEEEPVDVLGSWTLGFIGDLYTGQVSSAKRKLTDEEIKGEIGKKNPISHVTVFFRRDAVLKAGNYIELFYHEDYYLWVRMAELGATFRNIPEYLVYVRLGRDMAARRGGLGYYKAEKFLRRYMLSKGIISYMCYIKEMAIRFAYQLLIPASLRNCLVMRVKRKYLSKEEVSRILENNVSEDKEYNEQR